MRWHLYNYVIINHLYLECPMYSNTFTIILCVANFLVPQTRIVYLLDTPTSWGFIVYTLVMLYIKDATKCIFMHIATPAHGFAYEAYTPWLYTIIYQACYYT